MADRVPPPPPLATLLLFFRLAWSPPLISQGPVIASRLLALCFENNARRITQCIETALMRTGQFNSQFGSALIAAPDC